jgi:hypothetical protein
MDGLNLQEQIKNDLDTEGFTFSCFNVRVSP